MKISMIDLDAIKAAIEKIGPDPLNGARVLIMNGETILTAEALGHTFAGLDVVQNDSMPLNTVLGLRRNGTMALCAPLEDEECLT